MYEKFKLVLLGLILVSLSTCTSSIDDEDDSCWCNYFNIKISGGGGIQKQSILKFETNYLIKEVGINKEYLSDATLKFGLTQKDLKIYSAEDELNNYLIDTKSFYVEIRNLSSEKEYQEIRFRLGFEEDSELINISYKEMDEYIDDLEYVNIYQNQW